MFRKLNVYVSVIAFGLLSSLANAVTLEDVSFSSLPGERLEVTLQFDGAPPEPSGFPPPEPSGFPPIGSVAKNPHEARSAPLAARAMSAAPERRSGMVWVARRSSARAASTSPSTCRLRTPSA